MKNNIKNTSETLITVRSMAAILTQEGIKIGRNQLLERLRQQVLCIKDSNSNNVPTLYAMEHGLMKRRESIHNGRECPATSITEKGQSYILNMFLKEKKAA
jgi:anti-repressor protein